MQKTAKKSAGENAYANAGEELAHEVYPRGFWARSLRALLSPQHYRRVERFAVARAGGRCELCGAEGARQGGGGSGALVAHGRWDVNAAAGRVALRRVVACCPDCSLGLNLARPPQDSPHTPHLSPHPATPTPATRNFTAPPSQPRPAPRLQYKAKALAQKAGDESLLERAVEHVCAVRGWTDGEFERAMQAAEQRARALEPWYAEGPGGGSGGVPEANWVLDATLLTRNGVPIDPDGERRRAGPTSERQGLLAARSG